MGCEALLRRRIRGNPIEPLLARFIDHLVGFGYSADASKAYVAAADHLGRWLGKRPLNARAARRYLEHHLPSCRCRPPSPRDARWNAGAVRHLLALAGKSPASPLVPEGFASRVLERYREHLARDRGLKADTIKCSMSQAARTLAHLRARDRHDLRLWTPERVQRHVLREVQGRAGSTGQAVTSRIRVFLRFLHREGLIGAELAKSVPTVPFWRRVPVPPTLTRQTIRRLLAAAAADRSPLGLRNRAIVLCLSELGVRASDLTALQLDGVDWAMRILRLRQVKDRQEMALPISPELALALKAYLERGRPDCAVPWVFVHHRAPAGKPLSPHGVRDVLRKLSAAAGLPTPIGSSHAFRRAFAGRMLAGGASLKQIADVLGHQSIDTTVRYTHSDVKALAKVALPWPDTPAREVRP